MHPVMEEITSQGDSRTIPRGVPNISPEGGMMSDSHGAGQMSETGMFNLLIPNNDREEAVVCISQLVADDNSAVYGLSIYPDGFTIMSRESNRSRIFYRAETLQRALEKAKADGMPNDIWFRVMRSIRKNFETYRNRIEEMAAVAQADIPSDEPVNDRLTYDNL